MRCPERLELSDDYWVPCDVDVDTGGHRDRSKPHHAKGVKVMRTWSSLHAISFQRFEVTWTTEAIRADVVEGEPDGDRPEP